MEAYHNDKTIKDKYLARVRAHREADNLVQGLDWANGKGCAVGCTFENYDHERSEVELGIPEWLCRLEDTIFEGLPNEDAQMWPEQYLEAIGVGATDFENVKKEFLLFVQLGNLERVKKLDIEEELKTQVVNAIELCIKYLKGYESAARSARAAAELAESAARAAVGSARAAARSARAAAESAEAAAWSAEAAAWSESAARSARAAAWSAEYIKYRDELLRLLRKHLPDSEG